MILYYWGVFLCAKNGNYLHRNAFYNSMKYAWRQGNVCNCDLRNSQNISWILHFKVKFLHEAGIITGLWTQEISWNFKIFTLQCSIPEVGTMTGILWSKDFSRYLRIFWCTRMSREILRNLCSNTILTIPGVRNQDYPEISWDYSPRILEKFSGNLVISWFIFARVCV